MFSYQQIQERLQAVVSRSTLAHNGPQAAALEALASPLAWELAGLHQEWEQSNYRIMQHLEHKWFPDIPNRPLPAHTVVEAIPGSPTVELQPEQAFEFAPDPGAMEDHFYFSPLCKVKAIQGRMEFVACANAVYQVNNTQEKQTIPDLRLDTSVPKNELWLGIHLDDAVSSPEGLTLYLNSALPTGHVAAPDFFRQVMKLTRAEIQGRAVSLQSPFTNREASVVPTDFHEAYFMQEQVEALAINYYQDRFFQLGKISDDWSRCKCPWNLQEKHAVIFQEELLWIRLIFPGPLAPEWIDSLQVGINCFPALNRKMHVMDQEITGPEQAVPLTVHQLGRDNLPGIPDYFLALDKVFSSAQIFRPTIAYRTADVPLGSYSLQRGSLSHFNLEEAGARVNDLQRLLWQESELMNQVFAQQMHRRDLQELLFRLNQCLGELTAQVREDTPSQPLHILHLRPKQNTKNVFIHYWTTQGLSATHFLRTRRAILSTPV